jgi:hypothetical protein
MMIAVSVVVASTPPSPLKAVATGSPASPSTKVRCSVGALSGHTIAVPSAVPAAANRPSGETLTPFRG